MYFRICLSLKCALLTLAGRAYGAVGAVVAVVSFVGMSLLGCAGCIECCKSEGRCQTQAAVWGLSNQSQILVTESARAYTYCFAPSSAAKKNILTVFFKQKTAYEIASFTFRLLNFGFRYTSQMLKKRVSDVKIFSAGVFEHLFHPFCEGHIKDLRVFDNLSWLY